MNTTNTPPAQFKGSLFTLTILKIQRPELQAILQFTQENITKAPQFFNSIPLVLDLSTLTDENFSLAALITALQQLNLFPIGIISDHPSYQQQARHLHLPLFPKPRQVVEPKPVVEKTGATAPARPITQTKLITQPVRSGQQVYAKDADLIVVNSVSAGAEVLADGNIHIYGTLHGRALAGANGNNDARIFCNKLDAELLSIAGLYQLSEDFEQKKNKDAVQVFIQDERLVIDTL